MRSNSLPWVGCQLLEQAAQGPLQRGLNSLDNLRIETLHPEAPDPKANLGVLWAPVLSAQAACAVVYMVSRDPDPEPSGRQMERPLVFRLQRGQLLTLDRSTAVYFHLQLDRGFNIFASKSHPPVLHLKHCLSVLVHSLHSSVFQFVALNGCSAPSQEQCKH